MQRHWTEHPTTPWLRLRSGSSSDSLSERTIFITPDILGIPGVGIALAGIILNFQRATRSDIAALRGKTDKVDNDITELRHENGDQRKRMAKLQGLLEDLREAISGRKNAA